MLRRSAKAVHEDCLSCLSRTRGDIQASILLTGGNRSPIVSLKPMLNKLKQKGVLKGFKRTPQRLSILEHLDGNTSHPSAEDIYRVVAKKNPSMSFATVYNTLNTLVEAGAVRELTIDPDRKRYDPDTSAHHHLICMDCRKVVDIPDNVPVEFPRTAAKDFTVLGNHIEFYGLCGHCRKQDRAE